MTSRTTAIQRLVIAASLLVFPIASLAQGAAEQQPARPALYPASKAVDGLLLDVAYTGKRYVAVGNHGVILLSNKGADATTDLDWQQVQVPVSVMLNRLEFADEANGWAVGHDGVILHTSDGGASWTVQFRDASGSQAFYDIHVWSGKRAIAVGSGRAVITEDGGDSWEELQHPLFDLNWNFNAIGQLSNDCLFVAGERGLLARSCDDARSWEQVRTPYIGSFYGVLGYGPSGVVVFGMRGHVYVADDVMQLDTVDPRTWDPYMARSVNDPWELQALGWRRIGTPIERSLYGGQRYGAHRVVLVGVAGSTVAGDLRYDDLVSLPTSTNEPLSAVLARDQSLLTVGRTGVAEIPWEPEQQAEAP